MKITLFLRICLNIEIYKKIFQQILHQLVEEIEFKLNPFSYVGTVDRVELPVEEDQNVLMEFRKLRKFYIKTINNFSVYCERIHYCIRTEIFLGYIFLIIVLGIISICIRDKFIITQLEFCVLSRFFILFLSIGIQMYYFDTLESSVSIHYIHI